jgi:D-beta-D-heptose 7-phosphate kinase/D-beta-D-heptose 1-phosphate adenosyltransferase
MQNKKILVIGDVMLDEYVMGTVDRISPESPVPVVAVQEVKNVLGGAANVAMNITGLGVDCSLLGYIGMDSAASIVIGKLKESGINYKLTYSSNPTTTKTRIYGRNQQIVRIDRESNNVADETDRNALIYDFDREIVGAGAVIISDYNKSVCDINVCSHIIQKAADSGIKVFVDPKGDWSKYKGAYLIKPNWKEFCEEIGRTVQDDEIDATADYLITKYSLTGILITRGERGMYLRMNHSTIHIGSDSSDVVDVSGAGDTVISTFVSALCSWGNDPEMACRVASKAAGIVVRRLGTSSILKDDLDCGFGGKRLSNPGLEMLTRECRARGKRIVFTNGCFDIIHPGHVSLLNHCKTLGDIVIVGINSDSSVKRLKGDSRPINTVESRIAVLSGLTSVDYVITFSEDSPLNLIKSIHPDVIVKGGDYTEATVVGGEYCGKIIIFPTMVGHSSTRIINESNIS